MAQPLLEGEVDRRDEIILELRDENRELVRENQNLQAELSSAKVQNSRAISMLRHQLDPLYKALQSVYGVIEASGVEEDDDPKAGTNPRVKAVWESWKQKLGGKQAEFIQALLEHGSMTAVQLKVATHTGTSTVPQVIYKLNQLGLIDKNGGKYSLKQL